MTGISKVFFVGGPMDGQSVNIPDHQDSFQARQPLSYEMTANHGRMASYEFQMVHYKRLALIEKRGGHKHVVNIFTCLPDSESALDRVLSSYEMDIRRFDRFRWSLVNRIAVVARTWWRTFRPADYSEARQLEEPAVNTTTNEERALCEYIAQLVRLDREQN